MDAELDALVLELQRLERDAIECRDRMYAARNAITEHQKLIHRYICEHTPYVWVIRYTRVNKDKEFQLPGYFETEEAAKTEYRQKCAVVGDQCRWKDPKYIRLETSSVEFEHLVRGLAFNPYWKRRRKLVKDYPL